jgi:hypothetical protein
MHWQDFVLSGLDGDLGRTVRRLLGNFVLVAILLVVVFHVTWGFHAVWDLMMWRAHELLDPLTRAFETWMNQLRPVHGSR